MRDFTAPKELISLRGERSTHNVGILPITKSDWRYRFLAGNGESKSTCGVWMHRGCLEYKDHLKHALFDGQKTLYGEHACGVDIVEFYKASCGRLSCPICYEKACGKIALKIEHRMLRFKIRGRKLKAIHVVVSPSEKDIILYGDDFTKFRKKGYLVAMDCGVFGGSIIFHPFRKYNEDDIAEDVENGFSHKNSPASWYLSPHFHIIGYGWVTRVKQNYVKNGWIVKNLGVRKSIRATAHYQLSHCGVNKRFHSVVWFGALSYCKMSCPPLPPEKHECPLCNREMRKVEFIDNDMAHIVKSNLENEGVFLVDHGLFRYVDMNLFKVSSFSGG